MLLLLIIVRGVIVKTYVFGHRKPDTDSVCSAISYAYLKNQLGLKAEARVLGNLNKESKFVLNYFKIDEPKYLNDVKVQIKNMNYLKNAYLNEHASIASSFLAMQDLKVTGLPIVSDDQKLLGYINLKDICKYIIEGDIYDLKTSYDNILNVLNATAILRFNEDIKGHILAAAYKSTTFTDRIKLTSEHIVMVADRAHIIEYAINSGVKLIILVGNNKLSPELYKLANDNHVNVISTPYSTYVTANKIKLCNYINNIKMQANPISFMTSDYRDDFIDIATKYGHTNYPIIDNNQKCVGMLRLIDQNNYEKCNAILVDHNQEVQSVDGIEEANILEVIDHHNLGTIGTSRPISFRAMPVGCTSTIIYYIYKENNVKIPKSMAGIMLSAILSDTLLLKSPTTTSQDIEVANILAKLANVNINAFGMAMFKAGTSINNMDYEDVIMQDFKNYKLDDGSIGISQVITLDIDEIIKDQDKYINILNEMVKANNYKVAIMFVTDIIKNGSYVFYNKAAKNIISNAYLINNLEEGLFMPDVVSRKKQMLPDLMDYLGVK
jgi:manganese-dependent inorganic pyrophosphatase